MFENLPNKRVKEKSPFGSIPASAPLKRSIKNFTKYKMKNFPWTTDLKLLKKRHERIWNIKRPYTSQGLRDIKTALNSRKTIQEIYFVLTQYTQAVIPNLHHVNSFTKFTILQRIYFHFYGCTSITDKSLDHLSRFFKSLRFLKEISLKFLSCDKLTDLGLKSLVKLLQRCALLQKIFLSFQSCPQVTDTGLSRISKGLKRLTSLRSMKLDFSSCNITDMGLEELTKILKRHKCLQSLTLCFNYCNELTEGGMFNLCEAVDQLCCFQNLQQIYLSMRGGVTFIRKYEVKGRLKKCP